MDELQNLKDRMEQERPAPWEDLPDITLYMDQLISYMPRQLIRVIHSLFMFPLLLLRLEDG